MKTLTVDDFHRVRLPDVKPRTRFVYAKDEHGVIRLTKLIEKKPKSKVVRVKGRTLIDTDQPVTNEAVAASLADFP
jgi:hypothetical protein